MSGAEHRERFRLVLRTPDGNYRVDSTWGFILPLLWRMFICVVAHRLGHWIRGEGYRD